MTRLVLASQSPARATLLRQAGLVFDVRASAIDEAGPKRSLRDQGAAAAALHLAEAKAAIVDRRDGSLVIGADQILVCEGVWFDKPADMAEARQHLQRLRGRVHELVTAVVLQQTGVVVWSHVMVPRLTMRDLSDDAIDDILTREGDGLLQTVGAYKVEGLGLQLFSSIEGEWAAVLGLPMLALLEALRPWCVQGLVA